MPGSSEDSSEHNDDLTHVYDDEGSYTVPEILLLSLLLMLGLVALFLCMESTDCVQKLLQERKRLRKALQYKPSAVSYTHLTLPTILLV